ncbi:UPF0758 protein [Thalassotalea marina]|uniref:UPF0758 protein n=2 Tax=Thalassotalea marina TaxID=1673741 RepID=A0A919BH56_9GAMM|nr:UPF0758 protein [Thalassotalea marina]
MIKEWPIQEQPREKLLHFGAPSLSDAELLAIFLRTGVKGTDVVSLARQLLNTFGSISAIFQANKEEFCHIRGLGVAKFVQLQACLEMSKRYLTEELQQKTALTSSQDSKQFLVAQLRDETREVFAVLFLNTQHQVISFDKLFYGTINAAAVYPRVVAEQALKHRAASVILSHNHPSGLSSPSNADIRLTTQLVQALDLIDIKVLDHIIVAGHKSYSFADNRLL